MSLGALNTEADLTRFMERMLSERHGLIHANQIAGDVNGARVAGPISISVVDADPDPGQHPLLYAIDNSGLEVRVVFPNGTINTVSSD